MRAVSRLLPLLVVVAACSGKSDPKPDPTPPPKKRDPAPVVVEPSKNDRPSAAAIADAKAALIAKHGDAHKPRIERGVDQVASLWRASDGDLSAFVVEQFVAEPAQLDALFGRLEAQLEQIDGHVLELGRSVRWATEVESGPMLPVDDLLAAYDGGAHVIADLFASKVAFAALLNFPLTTLDDRLRD